MVCAQFRPPPLYDYALVVPHTKLFFVTVNEVKNGMEGINENMKWCELGVTRLLDNRGHETRECWWDEI